LTDPLQALLQQGARINRFPSNSRYQGIETTTLEMADRGTVIYLRRRFVPPLERFELLQEHTVVQGDRLDNLAAQYLGDPEQFWQLCDANGAMRPEELTETVGRTLRVTLPEGISGGQRA
jgi:hypothetical protein